MNTKFVFIVVLIIATLSIDVNSGRGGGFRGGGGFRSGSRSSGSGSRSYGNNNRGTSYGGGGMRGGSGMRWSSFGTGMIAYAAMSSLMRSGHGGYHGGYHNGYNSMYPNHRPTGQFCSNNEDFNGTKFGKFQCPLPGFDRRQKYCCGENELQYCCRYWDDSGRKGGTIVGILAVIIAILGISYCISRIIKQRNYFKNDNDHGYNDSPGPNMGPRPMGPNMGPRPMGPNMGPRPMGPRPAGPYPMGQNMGPRPMGPNMGPRPTGPPPNIGFKDDVSKPLINQNAPYPTQNTPYPTQMPQPPSMPQPNTDTPPSYTDTVRKDN